MPVVWSVTFVGRVVLSGEVRLRRVSSSWPNQCQRLTKNKNLLLCRKNGLFRRMQNQIESTAIKRAQAIGRR